MAPTFSIKIDGLDKVEEALRKYPERARKEFGIAISKSVRAVKVESQRRSPVDTNRLRGSIHVAKETPTIGEVKTGVKYAIFVHDGTRYMRSRPFMKEAVESLKRNIEGWFSKAMGKIFKSSV